jgi:CRP/FNR family cyclic AMP-dependent transcriptional regulator
MPGLSQTAAFDPQTLFASVSAARSITYQKNQIIFAQGDIAETVFYVETGRIKVSVQSEEGRSAVVGIWGPGQFFGEGCMNDDPLRIATTTAMEQCQVTAIAKPAMIALLHHQPGLSELFTVYLLRRNGRIEQDLIDQLFNSSEKRLARLLLLLADFGEESSSRPINPNISQETLAEMIGTTRPRVSSFMNKFRKMGFINYPGDSGKIEVHNSLLTAVLHDKLSIRTDD